MGVFYDLIWKLDYPLALIFAFVIFFIPLHKRDGYLKFLISGILSILATTALLYIPGFENSQIAHIIYYLMIFVLTFLLVYFTVDSATFSGASFILACIISLQHISYKVTVGVFILIDPNLLSQIVYFPVYIGISILFYVLSYFLFAKRIKNKTLSNSNIYSIIGVTSLMIISIIVNYFTYPIFFMEFENVKLISSLINLSGVLTVILIIMFLYTSALSIQRKEENNLLNLIATKDRERYELAKITIDEINIKYHDLSHALKNYNLDEGAAEEIKETLTNYKTIINTKNRGLNVVIYESQLKCIAKDIDLQVLIDGDPLSFMKSHHVYALLSNLIENAIEAVDTIKDKDNRRIGLKIYKKQNNVILTIKNHAETPIKFIDGYPVSSKKDKNSHGFGIRSSEKIALKYEGNMTVDYKDKEFAINIVIPYQEEVH